MRRVNLSGDSGEAGAASSITPRTKRLLVLLVIVAILGAGALAAQKFLFEERKPPSAPPRPLAEFPPPAPKAPEPAQPAPGVPAVSTTPSTSIPLQAGVKEKLGKPLQPKPETMRAEPGRKPAPPKQRYSIQVVSCVEEKNARSLMRILQAEGFSPRIVKGRAALTRHSVYVGDFSSQEEARETGERLQGDGVRATLEPMAQEKFSYLISSSFVLNEAIDMAHELLKKNYVPRIRSAQVQAPVYKVLVGRFSQRTETIKPIQRLREMGYSPILVKG